MLDVLMAVAGHPWAIKGDVVMHVQGLLASEGVAGLRHLANLRRTFDHSPKAMEDEDYGSGVQAARRGGAYQSSGSVAVIQVLGPVTQRGGMDMQTCEAFQSTDGIAAAVQAAVAEKSVDAIVLEFDSPGGSVFGVQEAWNVIMDARKQKPVVASVNSEAGSAAFYLASAANEIWVTPSGQIGSVGVFVLHVNAKERLKQMGLEWTFVYEGDFKVEGNPTDALSAEAKDAWQATVRDYYGSFNASLAKGRDLPVDQVRADFGKGRMVTAKAAVDRKMADAIGTFDEAVRRAGKLAQERRQSASLVKSESKSESAVPAPAAETEVERRRRVAQRAARLN